MRETSDPDSMPLGEGIEQTLPTDAHGGWTGRTSGRNQAEILKRAHGPRLLVPGG